ncbi:MAG: hypothetical protein ACRC80_02185 [Waterburya sp.]
MMKFYLWKFLALLLTGFLLFSLPLIINRFTVHDSVTHQLEEAPKQIHNWRQSTIAFHPPQRINLI